MRCTTVIGCTTVSRSDVAENAQKKKPETASFVRFMAGVTGFEPVLTVLETAVLPLTPHP